MRIDKETISNFFDLDALIRYLSVEAKISKGQTPYANFVRLEEETLDTHTKNGKDYSSHSLKYMAQIIHDWSSAGLGDEENLDGSWGHEGSRVGRVSLISNSRRIKAQTNTTEVLDFELSRQLGIFPACRVVITAKDLYSRRQNKEGLLRRQDYTFGFFSWRSEPDPVTTLPTEIFMKSDPESQVIIAESEPANPE